MAQSKDRLNRCFQLGYEGYKSGINAPALCVKWREHIKGLKVGEGAGAQEWNNGWYKAQREVSQSKFPELYQ